MIDLPFGFTFNWSIALSGITLAAIAGWIASIFSLRKDERAVQIDQITKERTKWREAMRKTTEDVVQIYWKSKIAPDPERVAIVRSKLVTAINPKDDKDDEEIIVHFDELFSGSKSDIEIFTKRIALLLKHDWERVKWECMPIYEKLFKRYTKKQVAWRSISYRKIDG